MSDAGRLLKREAGGIARCNFDRPTRINAPSADLLTDPAWPPSRRGLRQEVDGPVLDGASPKISRQANLAVCTSDADRDARALLKGFLGRRDPVDPTIPKFWT